MKHVLSSHHTHKPISLIQTIITSGLKSLLSQQYILHNLTCNKLILNFIINTLWREIKLGRQWKILLFLLNMMEILILVQYYY